MIVSEPPYELVAVFADLDAQKLFEQLIEKGQRAGCLHPFRWRSLRDSRRDTVWRSPQEALRAFNRMGCRFFLSWDFEGSGAENHPPAWLEKHALDELESAGICRQDVLVSCFEPELEKVLAVTWDRVKEIVAGVREQSPPDDHQILAKARMGSKGKTTDSMQAALRRAPKEVFEGLVAAVQLRSKSDLFERLGEKLSIPALKQDSSLSAIATRLASWFPGAGVPCGK